MSEVDLLRAEIADLQSRLSAADREKAQAGELGLQLLQEKELLERQLEQLQKEHDAARTELDETKQALSLFRTQRRNVADSELYNEEKLLEDSAKLEAEYTQRIAALENELKTLQPQLEHYKSEAIRLQNEHASSHEAIETLEAQKRQFKEELKDLKAREQRLLNDNNELEEENVTLQKQVSNLKSAQVEYEAMKMDIARLYEDTELLHSVAEEANKLRSLAEKQVEEALLTAQQEREQRIALKKELEHLRNAEHMSSLNSLLMGIKDANDGDDQNALKQLESSIIADGPIESHSFGASAKGSDLFSEIHGDLSDKVDQLEAEKDRLTKQLTDTQKSIMQMILPILKKLAVPGAGELSDFGKLKELIDVAIGRLDETGRSEKSEKRVEHLRSDLRQAILLAGQKNAKLNAAQDKMIRLSESLQQFYTEISAGDENTTARRQVNEIIQRLRGISESHYEKEKNERPPSPQPAPEDPSDDTDRDAKSPRIATMNLPRSIISDSFLKEVTGKLSNTVSVDELLKESDLRERLVQDEDDLNQVSDSLDTLLKLVRNAAEATVQSRMVMEDKDKAELYQTITKLKSLLAVKREQVSSLRTVLRSNKISTENALQSLRSKYESEKKLKDDALESLRKELKQFKEDAATFASHRAMFTARCEELQQQLESKEESLRIAEEEKHTLNQLLRMSIQRKLELTQRLEDLEMDRERHAQACKRPIRQPHTQRGGEVKAVRYPQSTNHSPRNNSKQ
ncbi:Cytoskeleton-like bicaudal D protein 2 [Aphelenchoides avenae]|nr:Cytoskeleton-like bicaudal D protein 2 [Aphelenchus avenae]